MFFVFLLTFSFLSIVFKFSNDPDWDGASDSQMDIMAACCYIFSFYFLFRELAQLWSMWKLGLANNWFRDYWNYVDLMVPVGVASLLIYFDLNGAGGEFLAIPMTACEWLLDLLSSSEWVKKVRTWAGLSFADISYNENNNLEIESYTTDWSGRVLDITKRINSLTSTEASKNRRILEQQVSELKRDNKRLNQLMMAVLEALKVDPPPEEIDVKERSGRHNRSMRRRSVFEGDRDRERRSIFAGITVSKSKGLGQEETEAGDDDDGKKGNVPPTKLNFSKWKKLLPTGRVASFVHRAKRESFAKRGNGAAVAEGKKNEGAKNIKSTKIVVLEEEESAQKEE